LYLAHFSSAFSHPTQTTKSLRGDEGNAKRVLCKLGESQDLRAECCVGHPIQIGPQRTYLRAKILGSSDNEHCFASPLTFCRHGPSAFVERHLRPRFDNDITRRLPIRIPAEESHYPTYQPQDLELAILISMTDGKVGQLRYSSHFHQK
jgi:hypothetical protein